MANSIKIVHTTDTNTDMPQKKALSTVSIKDDSIQFLDDFFDRSQVFQRRIKIPLPGEVSSIELTLYLPKPLHARL